MLLTAVMSGIIVFLSQMIFRIAIFGGRNRKTHPAVLIIGLVFVILSPIFAQMIRLAVSRRREYLADSSGVVLTRYPPGLADALEKIKGDSHVLKGANGATAHLFISNPVKKKISGLFSTHPPINERIKRLREM
jgi:heat shock protein HtpX